MIGKLSTFRRLQKRNGTVHALKITFSYLSPFHDHRGYYQDKRVDNKQRIELINSEIEKHDGSVLDIGCADATILSEISKNGLFCIGIEQRERHVKRARERTSESDNIGIIKSRLTPKNIESIPKFDIVLMLTVYQHFAYTHTYKSYRSESEKESSNIDAAEKMLRIISNKSNKIFFEIYDSPPGDDFATDRFSFNTESPREFWPNYFEFVLDNTIDVKYLGKTDYRGGDRDDVHFLINTEDYNLNMTPRDSR